MAVPTGIEPAISCVTGRHVNRYTTGPSTLLKKHPILLPKQSIVKMVEDDGIEPPTPCL